VASAWENAVSGSGESDELLTITLASALPNYVDADGYAYLLTKTVFPSNGNITSPIRVQHKPRSRSVCARRICRIEANRSESNKAFPNFRRFSHPNSR